MKEMSASKRDYTIDIVRGIAIVTMVGANLAVLLPEPHSMYLRYYSSFAAPIFVCLAGAMMAMVIDRNLSAKRPLAYFLKRGLFLLAVAAIVDVLAWNFVPFIGFDVLYLLGFSLPLLFLSAFLDLKTLSFLALAVFVATPLLQTFFGYSEIPTTLSVWELSAVATIDLTLVMRHWFIDGWFPFFPWIGYGLVGVILGKWRWHSAIPVRRFDTWPPFLLAAACLFLGSIGMLLNPGPIHSRIGFSELFYPASGGFILLSIGVVVGLVVLVDAAMWPRLWSPFRIFGEASLFMYVFHSLVVGALDTELASKISVTEYVLVYMTLIAFLMVCGIWLRSLRRKHPNMPTMMKWVVGG